MDADSQAGGLATLRRALEEPHKLSGFRFWTGRGGGPLCGQWGAGGVVWGCLPSPSTRGPRGSVSGASPGCGSVSGIPALLTSTVFPSLRWDNDRLPLLSAFGTPLVAPCLFVCFFVLFFFFLLRYSSHTYGLPTWRVRFSLGMFSRSCNRQHEFQNIPITPKRNPIPISSLCLFSPLLRPRHL